MSSVILCALLCSQVVFVGLAMKGNGKTVSFFGGAPEEVDASSGFVFPKSLSDSIPSSATSSMSPSHLRRYTSSFGLDEMAATMSKDSLGEYADTPVSKMSSLTSQSPLGFDDAGSTPKHRHNSILRLSSLTSLESPTSSRSLPYPAGCKECDGSPVSVASSSSSMSLDVVFKKSGTHGFCELSSVTGPGFEGGACDLSPGSPLLEGLLELVQHEQIELGDSPTVLDVKELSLPFVQNNRVKFLAEVPLMRAVGVKLQQIADFLFPRDEHESEGAYVTPALLGDSNEHYFIFQSRGFNFDVNASPKEKKDAGSFLLSFLHYFGKHSSSPSAQGTPVGRAHRLLGMLSKSNRSFDDVYFIEDFKNALTFLMKIEPQCFKFSDEDVDILKLDFFENGLKQLGPDHDLTPLELKVLSIIRTLKIFLEKLKEDGVGFQLPRVYSNDFAFIHGHIAHLHNGSSEEDGGVAQFRLNMSKNVRVLLAHAIDLSDQVDISNIEEVRLVVYEFLHDLSSPPAAQYVARLADLITHEYYRDFYKETVEEEYEIVRGVKLQRSEKKAKQLSPKELYFRTIRVLRKLEIQVFRFSEEDEDILREEFLQGGFNKLLTQPELTSFELKMMSIIRAFTIVLGSLGDGRQDVAALKQIFEYSMLLSNSVGVDETDQVRQIVYKFLYDLRSPSAESLIMSVMGARKFRWSFQEAAVHEYEQIQDSMFDAKANRA